MRNASLFLVVKAPPGECAVDTGVCRQERQHSWFGWWVGRKDAASLLLGPRGSVAALHWGHQRRRAGCLS